ncbi:hypothetical protein GCM10027199_61820 [Amycolatopsis magusensis]
MSIPADGVAAAQAGNGSAGGEGGGQRVGQAQTEPGQPGGGAVQKEPEPDARDQRSGEERLVEDDLGWPAAAGVGEAVPFTLDALPVGCLVELEARRRRWPRPRPRGDEGY